MFELVFSLKIGETYEENRFTSKIQITLSKQGSRLILIYLNVNIVKHNFKKQQYKLRVLHILAVFVY